MQNAGIRLVPHVLAQLCVACGNELWLARIVPRDEGEEVHIFTCSVCEQTQSKVVKFELDD